MQEGKDLRRRQRVIEAGNGSNRRYCCIDVLEVKLVEELVVIVSNHGRFFIKQLAKRDGLAISILCHVLSIVSGKTLSVLNLLRNGTDGSGRGFVRIDESWGINRQ